MNRCTESSFVLSFSSFLHIKATVARKVATIPMKILLLRLFAALGDGVTGDPVTGGGVTGVGVTASGFTGGGVGDSF